MTPVRCIDSSYRPPPARSRDPTFEGGALPDSRSPDGGRRRFLRSGASSDQRVGQLVLAPTELEPVRLEFVRTGATRAQRLPFDHKICDDLLERLNRGGGPAG